MKAPVSYKVHLPVYLTQFILVIAETAQEALDHCNSFDAEKYNDYDAPDHSEGSACVWWDSTYRTCTMFLPYRHLDRNMITHEVNHVVYSILLGKGMRLVPESEEAFTYLSGHLIDVVNYFLDQNKVKVKSVSINYEEYISNQQADLQGYRRPAKDSGGDNKEVLEGQQQEGSGSVSPDS